MKVKDIMVTHVITVKQSARIEEIAKVLIDNGISGAPVVDEQGKLVGIVSEKDILHKEATPRLPNYISILGAIIYFNGVERYNDDFKKLLAREASDIMTAEVVTTSGDADIHEVADLMIKHNVKRIPVVADDKIVGIISRSDIIKTLLS